MAFTVEDGTGVAGANALIATDFADTYHADRGNSAWTGSGPDKQRAIVRATDWLCAEVAYRGRLVEDEQALAWPRQDIQRASDGFALPDDEIPLGLQRATAELAMIALTEDLRPALTEGRVATESEKSGSLSKTKTYVTDDSMRFPKVMALLVAAELVQSQAQAPILRA